MIQLTLTHGQAMDLLTWVELAVIRGGPDLRDVEQELIDKIYGNGDANGK